MPDLVIAARDAGPADRDRAEIVCDGRTDLAVLAKAVAASCRTVELRAGTFNANGGLPRLVAETGPCRIAVVVDRPQSAVEVHGPSVNSVNLGGVTVE